MNRSIYIGAILLTLVIVNGMFIAEKKTRKVTVSLFYETLCPGCKFFSKYNLCPLYNSSLSDFTTIELVPYGNAHTQVANSTITITCQHGADECWGNAIQACAVKHLSTDLSIRFVCCVEAADAKDMEEDCAKQLGFDYDILTQCADSSEGIKLLYLNGVKTGLLRPEHEYVPWVTLNGKNNSRAEYRLQEEVCKLLIDPPRECNEVDYFDYY